MTLLALFRNKPKTEQSVPNTNAARVCKCCGARATFFGSADRAKTCEDHKKKVFPNTGTLVDYFRCESCGFVFTDFMDSWSAERVQSEIYNDDYAAADPDFVSVRPLHNARYFSALLAHVGTHLSVLDFGGGDGALIKHMKRVGHKNVVSYDPFYDNSARPSKKFDLITAFEVVEHVPDTKSLFLEIQAFMQEDGVFLFSTLLQPSSIAEEGTAWWYLAPRNGHVSLHTRESLQAAARAVGLEIITFDHLLHAAFVRKPSWFAKLEAFVRRPTLPPEHLDPSNNATPAHKDDDAASITATSECRHGKMTYLRRDQYVGKSLAVYKEFSEGEVEIFQQLLRNGDIVFEAGANIGAHTVAISRLIGAEGKVYAYEPQQFIYDLLCKNIADNELNNVIARCAAVGAITGSIVVPRLDYSKSNNFGGVPVGVGQGDTVAVETIDELTLEQLRMIKADVEGMEADVLRGAVDTIWRLRPLLYVECDRADKSSELIALIQSFSYRLWLHVPSLFNPNNFANVRENVFGDVGSFNLLCIPEETSAAMEGWLEITDPKQRFLQAHGR